MAASYPGATKSFSTKVDGPGQTIFAAHINDPQDEIVAVENALLVGFAHALKAISGTNALPGVGVGATNVGVYSSGANALDFATNGVKALGIDSTQFIDSPTQPRCVAFHSTTQSLANTTETALLFNSEDLDVGGLHDTAANTSRLTIPTGGDGFYAIVAWPAPVAGAGFAYGYIRKNGATVLGARTLWPLNGTSTAPSPVIAFAVLAAADYVEVVAFQSSGGALNFGDAASRISQNQIAIVKLW